MLPKELQDKKTIRLYRNTHKRVSRMKDKNGELTKLICPKCGGSKMSPILQIYQYGLFNLDWWIDYFRCKCGEFTFDIGVIDNSDGSATENAE